MNEDDYKVNLMFIDEATLVYRVQALLQEAVKKRPLSQVRDLAIRHSEPADDVPSLASPYKVLRWTEGDKGFSVRALFRVRDAALLALGDR